MIPQAVRETIEKGNLPELSEIPASARPMSGKLFVKLDEVEEKTEGGIIKPETARDLGVQNTCWPVTVLRVPSDHDAEIEGYKEGDRLLVLLSYMDVKNGGRTTTIVRKEVVEAVLG